MEPQYLSEIRYSYLVGSWRRSASSAYESTSPEGEFERHLQELFLEGQAHLRDEEFNLALQDFEEARALILRTVHPTLPVDPSLRGRLRFPIEAAVVESLVAKTAEILVRTKPAELNLPASVFGTASTLPAAIGQELAPAVASGLQVTSFHEQVQVSVNAAIAAAGRRDWGTAAALYQQALEATPDTAPEIRGGLLHDLAVLTEKEGDRGRAQELGEASVLSFAHSSAVEAHAQALATTAGILARGGNEQRATELTGQLQAIEKTTNLNELVAVPAPAGIVMNVAATRTLAGRVSPAVVGRLGVGRLGVAVQPQGDAADAPFELNPGAPELMGLRFVAEATPEKTLTILGTASRATITLQPATSVDSTRAFLATLSETRDVGLLTSFLTPVQFVAYIPHMYSFVLPMSIGDAHAGLGDLEEARDSYASVLGYEFINRTLEIVRVWTRLAQTLLDLGDRAYRNAKDDVAAFAEARAAYEQIARADRSIDPASILYADAKFADIRARVGAFLAAADPLAVDDNPAVLTIVLQAVSRLGQIEAGLNFFGFGPDYVPPFSFEYLQNTARYFAQHASQTEQRYIQYKSQAENEEFRREQLDQQAEVARQSVILEQRGEVEAQRGVDVARASRDYAAVQVQNAEASRDDFANARWELLELSTLEAWAGASSVDRDDQVKLTITGYDYYGADHKRRNVVLKELAYQRTLLTHDLEAARLDRAVTSAEAYQGVSEAQLAQAQARVAVAHQRAEIARLQQRQAEQNRDFLDMREFSARLWYELAQQARRLTRRYLDMATEIAFLMERAYNAETERGLSVIRYDYGATASGGLMGADLLTADIDSFTHDYVTTTKTRKIPVKQTISLADAYPTQFHRLQATGSCSFETTFADFDRRHPGLYLAKIRNVEVVFVGLGGASSIAGTLRNIGVSRFRRRGGEVVDHLHGSDVMVLSQYEIRQDSLAFRFNPNDLRLFENAGIETVWQLDLPADANDLDYAEILDVHLVLYYDGFFDPTLEGQVRASLPAGGSAARAVSLRFAAPDELFYLKHQGEAEVVFDAAMFPRTQRDLVRTTTTIRVTGTADVVAGLTLHLASDVLGAEVVATTDADGEVKDGPGSPLQALAGRPVLDRWQLAIRAADNPQLVAGGALVLDGLEDVAVFFEYQFTYR